MTPQILSILKDPRYTVGFSGKWLFERNKEALEEQTDQWREKASAIDVEEYLFLVDLHDTPEMAAEVILDYVIPKPENVTLTLYNK